MIIYLQEKCIIWWMAIYKDQVYREVSCSHLLQWNKNQDNDYYFRLLLH